MSKSTISASAGSVPIALNSRYVPKKRSTGVRRSARFPTKKAPNKPRSNPLKVNFSPPRYPPTVTCGELVEVVATKTSVVMAATTLTIKAATPITTSTSTTNSTITDISSLPDATTTTTSVNVTTTNLGLTATTTTINTTNTNSIIATATTYAACASENFDSSSNGGQPNLAFGFPDGESTSKNPGSTAYDCCVNVCANNADYGTFVYADSLYLLSIIPICSPAMTNGQSSSNVGNSPGVVALTISNSNCGKVADFGDVLADDTISLICWGEGGKGGG